MLREAMAFPRGREGATRDLLVGGLLILASVAVIPALLVYGYLLQVMAVGARGRDRVPAFGGWSRLLLDGLRGVVVVFVYGVFPSWLLVGGVAATVVYVLPGVALDALREGSVQVAAQYLTYQQLAFVAGVATVLAVAAFVLALHLPAALVAVGTQGRLGAAFQTGALWTVVNTGPYLKGVVLAAAVYVLGTLVAVPLSVVLVGFVVQFYVLVAVAFILGRSVGGAAVTAIRPTAEI